MKIITPKKPKLITTLPEFVPTDQQAEASKQILDWYALATKRLRPWRKRNLLTNGDFALSDKDRAWMLYLLFGWGGTGKTTMVVELLPELMKIASNICIAAPTNKAANTLNEMIEAVVERTGMRGLPEASTIHKLIYLVYDDDDEIEEDGDLKTDLQRRRKPDSWLWGADLLIIDESSMVGQGMGKDLDKYGVPILPVGDPKQIQPVEDRSYYTRGRQPNFVLTQRTRTLDPDIQYISDLLREEKPMPQVGYHHGSVRVIFEHQLTDAEMREASIILTATHETRHAYNRRVRAVRGYQGMVPNPGEIVVCDFTSKKEDVKDLTDPKNEQWVRVANGTFWIVKEAALEPAPKVNHQVVRMILETRQHPDPKKRRKHQVIEVRVFPEWLHGEEEKIHRFAKKSPQRFAFGYATTIHKAQSDGYQKVVMIHEPISTSRPWDWQYTGVTRAETKLTIVWKPGRARHHRRRFM